MRSSLEEFLQAIANLRAFVVSLEPVYRFLDSHEDRDVRSHLNSRRQLDCVTFFVALYTVFEKFVEDLAWSHCDLYSRRILYSALPEKMREKHLRGSADLVARRRLGEGRYSGITSEGIVANLHSCLSDHNPYTLNRHALLYHERNLRADVIQEIFTTLGIEAIHTSARSSPPLLEWFRRREGLDQEKIPSGIPVRLIDEQLRDLVGRRNEVSHGGLDIQEVLSGNQMEERLLFLEAYGKAIFRSVVCDNLLRHYVGTELGNDLGRPREGPFEKGRVGVFTKPDFDLSLGQPLFGVRGGRVDGWSTVSSLRHEEKEVDRVDRETPGTTVGIGIEQGEWGFRLKRDTRVFLLPAQDRAVWG